METRGGGTNYFTHRVKGLGREGPSNTHGDRGLKRESNKTITVHLISNCLFKSIR